MTNLQTRVADIFCKVIDNYGDIGVCWRLCKQLVARGEARRFSVRLIVDDASALTWMASAYARTGLVEVMAWDQAEKIEMPADLVIEAFGCHLPESYIAKMARQAKLGKACTWVNLEYLTAEPYAQACHLLPSPVMQGAGKGLTKTFFYPGFTHQTGGLLREPDLLERQARFNKLEWLKKQHIDWHKDSNERIVSLFCYEPAALSALLAELQSSDQPTLLLVTAGRASHFMKHTVRTELVEVPSRNNLRVHDLPYLTQEDYDHLLWASDFNFVRGEDSLIRAIWAGKPFVWQIYPQNDDAHHAKLKAFLDVYLAHTDANVAAHIRAAHAVWNGVIDLNNRPVSHVLLGLAKWQAASLMQRGLWADLPDLVNDLVALR
ncbi:MAG: elongation factor P maturation arginine rhamnosyltransferase EarP [Cytophagales bacterium]|nr:elongation factor P maturation arginine rhamnosyltransferase EarP [Cytophagales bacterium]